MTVGIMGYLQKARSRWQDIGEVLFLHVYELSPGPKFVNCMCKTK